MAATLIMAAVWSPDNWTMGIELNGSSLTNSRLTVSLAYCYRTGSLRHKVLVSVLNTGQSGLGNGSVVGLLVVFDNSNHLVGSSILTGEEEFDGLGRLSGKTF